MSDDRRSLFKMSGLPEAFGVLLLTLALVLAGSPYLAGVQIANLNFPTLGPTATKTMKIVGPVFFFVLMFAFLPIWPMRRSEITSPATEQDESADDGPSPLIDLDEHFAPVEGPESLRPTAIDIAERVARSIRPYFRVRLRAIESLTKEVAALQNSVPRTEADNRLLAALKTRLQWLGMQQEHFSAAIEVVLTSERLRTAHKVPLDDRAVSTVILGMLDLLFGELTGEHVWYLSKPGLSTCIPVPITEKECRDMHRGMFIGDPDHRTLAQCKQQDGFIPLTWLDSEIYFRKVIPAIVASVLECRNAQHGSKQQLEQVLDLSTWRVSFTSDGGRGA